MLGLGVERAVRVALEAHRDQVRRGSGAPYVVHPVQVALLLSRLGASEQVVQAGLLHDVVEDCEAWTLSRVAAEFGEPVAEIVAEVTEDKSLSWDARKWGAVEGVEHLSSGALLVKACDKLHNLQSLARDLEEVGPDATWAHFRGGLEKTRETSRALVGRLAARVGPPLDAALREALEAVFGA